MCSAMRWFVLRAALTLIFWADTGVAKHRVRPNKALKFGNRLSEVMRKANALNYKPSFEEITNSEIETNIRRSNIHPAEQARPVIHLCGLFALRFEAAYMLPWIAHHSHYGVDHFHLYMDDASPSWSDDLLETYSHILELLRQSPKVTLYSMKDHGIHGQEGQVEHCVVNTAFLADWVGNWDFDESLSTQKYDGNIAGVLKRVLRALPTTALGVTIPRNDVYAHAKHADAGEMPFLDDQLEYEQYTVRFNTDVKGKSLWRTGSHVFPMPLAGHFMMAPDALKHTVVAPDGTSIANGTHDRMIYKCNACRAPSLATYRAMQNGLENEVAVFKELEIAFSNSRLEKETSPRRQRRNTHRKRSRARSGMHSDMLARWNVGSEAAKAGNITRTWSFVKSEQENMDAQRLPKTGPLPDWVGVLALNHYQRSYGECTRKADFVQSAGSIFAVSKMNVRTRGQTLHKRCRINRGKGTDDTTLASETPFIWEKLTEMFGREAKEHQIHVQRIYRQHVSDFLNNTNGPIF